MEFGLDNVVMGNTLRLWLVASVTVAAMTILMVLFRRVLITRYVRMAARTPGKTDDHIADVLSRTHIGLLLPVALSVGIVPLSLPGQLAGFIRLLAMLGVIAQVGLWLDRLVVSWIDNRLPHWDAARATTMSLTGFVVRVLVWTVLIFSALNTIGFDITALMAGFGIGGIAVALAAQNVLGDLLASLSIVFDKPFLIGDFVVVDDKMGTVEHIGIKTTRIRSLSGEQIIFANNDLLKSRIRNYRRMYERRVVLTVGVTYETAAGKLERIPTMIREIIAAQDKTRFDRSHFMSFGDFSLIFETVYYVLDPDYNVYMDIQHAIGIAIIRRFEAEGISFAYPTQTLHVHREAAGAG